MPSAIEARPTKRFAPSTSEADLGRLIDAVTADQREVLLGFLDERAPGFAGRGANAVTRIRGYAMAAFERVGLPDAGLRHVVDELESAHEPFAIAAAARALRGMDVRERRVTPFILRAISRVRLGDDTVSFDSVAPTWPARTTTTALAELFGTLAWLGPNAGHALPEVAAMRTWVPGHPASTRSAHEAAMAALQAGGPLDDATCCPRDVPHPLEGLRDTPRGRRIGPPPSAARFEDQDGDQGGYDELIVGKPAVLAFFYTRCVNPNKCSLTVTKLGHLQRRRHELGLDGRVRVLAVTYDPTFDDPGRLGSYAAQRGMTFGPDDRVLRCIRRFDRLARYFELGVNYGPATVNRHRIEAFIVDPQGRIVLEATRLPWDVDELLDAACATVERQDGTCRESHTAGSTRDHRAGARADPPAPTRTGVVGAKAG